ncbi:mechanosensitive ion channel family protein [Aurantiacibacter poecillastricola]|uniref:mechanosensitive ion channel family protein n=1 Tax=Aurantiacibacter poecillastricola TaxID=3064385 RepID=UPI00273F4397|nr:mechanosensitive ion channel family protein [Aurantiacibacter sp. 219JJ12-13]MDP5260232.1 mechanosensitive ion channel family protein [Aurantiacibacter sp. 219JJ12-13]
MPESAESPAPAPPTPSAGSIELEQAAGEDERIAARLSDIFSNVPSLSQVEVDVSMGVVTLSGVAPDEAALARAEAIATGVEGVATVENTIERDVSVDIGEDIGGLGDRLRELTRALPQMALAVLVGLAIAAIGYLIASFTGLWRRVAPNGFLAELLASAVRFIFTIAGIVIALDMIGAGALLGAVLGGAGVIGIALGFAMRDTVENYVASLMLSLRQPFRANDHVVIDTQEGRVIRLTSRATVLMTLDGNHLRIPNSTVFKAVILNYTRNPQRRFDFELGVDADDDAEAARQLGRETLAKLDFVLKDPPPEVQIDHVGDSNVVLTFFAWVDQRQADFLKARSRAIAAAKRALEEGGFALPEPIYRLRFDQRTVPLPFENVGPAAGEGRPAARAPPSPPPPRPSPAPVAIAEDIAPEDEIARMVNEERASDPGQEKDLLDSSRPVE